MTTDDHVVICGKPHTGKTTLARKMCGPNDIVFDLDAICGALNPLHEGIKERSTSVALLALSFRHYLVEQIVDYDFPLRTIIIISNRDQALKVARQIGAELIVCPVR